MTLRGKVKLQATLLSVFLWLPLAVQAGSYDWVWYKEYRKRAAVIPDKEFEVWFAGVAASISASAIQTNLSTRRIEWTLCNLPYPRLSAADLFKLMDTQVGSILDSVWSDGDRGPTPIEYVAWHIVREKYSCK